ncbi:MAG: hypothetical protein E7022_03915 [Desulfovibrio desulfuricans]|nr:hypothetical protein [Desulfovibrio desulfuricans]
MSQGIDIDAFRKGYNARMGIEDEAPAQPAPAPEIPAADVADAESVAPDSITDMGEVETIDLSSPDTAQPGATLPTDTVVDVLSTWKSPTDARADFEAESLPQTLHALHNSLNVNPFELKDLADRAGLTYSVVDADSGFARKKIASDRHAEVLRGFMDNISQTPKTAAFVRQADSVEQLALTSDVALAALEKDLDPAQRGFFDSGYIGAARNAWNNGMLAREVGDLAVKWMDGSITDDEHRRLDALRQAQTYFQQQRENMGLLERMVRGSVEALGVPLAGGVEGAVQFLGRYGKEGLAGGAMLGAGVGTAAGGAGAVPGAILGGVTGLSAVAQAGFMNDMMRQEGAQTFLSLVDMGVPEDTARVLAIAAGGAKGLLEYVGLREVGRVFPGAEKFLTREAATAALNTLKRNPSLAAALGDAGLAALRGIAGETGTEVLQEGVDIVAEDTGRRLSGVNRAAPTLGEIGARLTDTAIQTIESTALVAGVGGAARGARNYARNNRRESLLAQIQDAQSRTLDTVAQAAQNSPVMKDMAGTGEALMQHLADAGVTPETLYIRPEAVQQMFFQEENPELMAAAADMGITPESLQENLTLGTDVAVDFAKATRHIMADPQRYEALRQDMRLEPSMLTDAEAEELAAMNQDAEARLAYLDNLLAPVSEEAQAAQTRYDQRMETAAPYVEQLWQAGYSENQANAFGLVLAANAERMAPVFGLTPQEYLAQRFAGYHSMTQEEFERLASGGLDGLFENRELASMLQDMGVTKNMSRSRKRRQLQPEFDYAYGRVDAESVKSLYGQERINELRRQFGPGFFAKKGEGTPLDVLAQNFAREERGGYELGAEEIDADAFAEKIFAPHDEFEAGLAGQLRQRMLWQEQTAAEKLAQDVAAWEKTVDDFIAGKLNPRSSVTILSQTPLVLSLLGANKDLRVNTDYGKLKKILQEKHKLPENVLKQLPAAMTDPIMIFDSATMAGDYVMMLDLRDENGATVVVPVSFNYEQGRGYVVNYVPSVYAKKDAGTGKPNDGWFKAQVEEGRLRYVNKRKAAQWASSSRLQSPWVGTHLSGKNRIRTEADLVNLRQQNPTYYQNEEDAVQTPEQTYASGMAAMNTVIAEHTDALDAMFRPEVGSISFYWGQEGKGPKGKGGSGVAHIIARRNAEGKDGEAVARKMVEVLAYGEIGPEYGPQDGQHRNVSFDGHTAVLSLYRFGNRQTWLLTGWEDNPAGETGTVNAPSPTQASPSGIRDRLGAAESSVGNTVRPLGADGKPLFSRVSPGRARGAMSRLPDGRAVVGLFKSRNASTVLHETAHFWLEELREAAQLDTAPDWVRDVWGKLQKAYGFEGALNGLSDVARWTEVQERFAREFEAYARDGKAPSWELQSAFNRFRNWLTEIYRSVRAVLGMNDVSEDVREVFDALLATQEEIEQSQRAVAADSVMELLDEKETTPELRNRYARAAQRAYENASAVIANRRLVDRRAAEKDIRQQVTAEIDGSETYTMLARLREGGLDFDALKAAISEDVAYRLREKWHAARGEGKALIRKGGALDLLDVAAQFDQDSVQGLAGALLDTPTRREAIGAETERRLAQWDARYDAEVEYSNAWDAALAVELEALTGQRQISPAQLRQQMDERTGVKKMSAVDAEYKTLKARLQSDERAARRAWNAAKREAGAAAREKIAALKEQERLRRAALGAAYRARMERDNIIRQLRKIGNSKSVPYDYMCQIRRLLQRWDGLGTEGQRLDPATLRGLKSLQEFLAEKSADSLFDEPLTAPDWLLADQTGRFSDLSIEQMRDVKRLIQELAHAGRTEGRMLADKEKREIKAVADECAAAAMQLSARDYISDRAGVLDTIKGALRKGLSSLTSVRFLARALDGFNDHGVNHDAWLMPLQMARTEELTLQREMEEKLREALKPLLRVGQLQKAFSIDGVPLRQDVSRQWAGMWDMDKVYSVALNMGNAGNLKALMQGYGWSEEHLQAITARLTAEEWQAVQAVWDAIDTLYPRLNDVYKTLKGVPLPKVKAQAFTVQTADGQTLTLKGGYYPLIFDQRLSDKAAENQSVDELLNGMEAVLRSPNPKSGMTKERKGGTLPPKLSLTVLDRHVTDTVHYVTHALPLRDTMRLFREPSFKEAFIRAAGQENYDQLLPWLRGIARPGGEQAQGIVKAIDWLARRGSLYALGANMKSALLQLTSIGNSWSEVGFGNFLRASATMLSAPRENWDTVRQKSAYMQNRARLLDDTLRREYEDMRGRGVRGVSLGGRRFSLDVVRQAQMALMIAMDAAVAYPTWLAAYDRAIAHGVDEARAVAEADGAVVAAQGGGGPLDTPAVMRQASLMRALCPFMSFALSDFNRKMETLRGFAEWARTGHSSVTPARLFRDFALQWVMPVTLTVLMVSLGREGEPPEGEDFLWEALTFYTMGIPIVRDVAKQTESYFSEHGYKGGRSPLMLAGLDNAVRGLGHAYKAWDEGDPDAEYRAMKETLNAVGFALGLGTPQIWRTLEGSEAYWIDGEGGPLAPLLGKPQK